MDPKEMNTKELPEALSRMIKAEKVKINQVGGEINLTPITLDKPIAMSQEEKEARGWTTYGF